MRARAVRGNARRGNARCDRYDTPMLYAITREVSESIAHCQLTHIARHPINIEKARQQHAAYEHALKACGATILHAPPEPTMPDAVFVEDTALVLPEIAIILRPGAESRQSETPRIATLLLQYRPLEFIRPPATIDGGDILQIGKSLVSGRSPRTNHEGIAQLTALARRWGYAVTPVEVSGCLHLKSAATCLGEETILANAKWIDPRIFRQPEIIEVDPGEPFAANALRIANRVLFPEHFPRTRKILEDRGINILPVPADELAKAEGALTCCSILFES